MHPHRHGHRDPVIRGASAVCYARVVSRWVLPPLYRAAAGDIGRVAPPGGAVVDVGTGPGQLLVELHRRRPDLSLVGVDPSEDMVALAEPRLRASRAGATTMHVHVAAAEELPFADESVDVVVSTMSAHHWHDPGRAVAEQARVLRRGGQVRVYDLRGPAAALEEHWAAARLSVVPDPPTALGRLARLVVTAVVAVKPATGPASA